eukprot:Gb_27498 [translate_table: standard]
MSSCESSTGSSPVLRDLHEKKQSLRRIASEVGSMASELRHAAEAKAKNMEIELQQLQESLESKSSEAQTSASVVAEQVKIPERGWVVPDQNWNIVTKLKIRKLFELADKYLRELEDVRSKLATVQDLVGASETSTGLAQSRCSELLKELDKKNSLIQEHENQVTRLGQQLAELHKDLQSRETSQRHLREEVLKLEQEIKLAVSKAGTDKDCELRILLEEISLKNIKNLAKHLSTKDEELVGFREEVKILSAQLKHKTRELEAQLEKQQKADQDLKKRVLKLEFYLQEACLQTLKLQRVLQPQIASMSKFENSTTAVNDENIQIAERRDRELKELHVKALLRENGIDKQKFWESSRFKYLVSLSVVILLVFAKQ